MEDGVILEALQVEQGPRGPGVGLLHGHPHLRRLAHGPADNAIAVAHHHQGGEALQAAALGHLHGAVHVHHVHVKQPGLRHRGHLLEARQAGVALQDLVQRVPAGRREQQERGGKSGQGAHARPSHAGVTVQPRLGAVRGTSARRSCRAPGTARSRRHALLLLARHLLHLLHHPGPHVTRYDTVSSPAGVSATPSSWRQGGVEGASSKGQLQAALCPPATA